MTANKAPAISVVMGVYNGAGFLEEAIESILQQTFRDFEFIIIDDGSTDRTPQLIKRWARRDSRIVARKNPANIGLAKTLNRGIKEARGQWIARQDADDRSLPERFEHQMDFLAAAPEVGLLGAGCWIIDKNGQRQPLPRTLPQTHGEICWHLLWQNPFYHSAVIFRRQLAQAHLYDETLASAQDFELWGRILQVTRGANLQEPLLESRRHPNRTSDTASAQQQKNAAIIMAKRLNELMPDHGWPEEVTTHLRKFVKNPWPDGEESADHWLLFLDTFKKFEKTSGMDQAHLAMVRRQILERFSVSLLTSTGVKANRSLLTAFWRYGGLEFSSVAARILHGKLAKKRRK